MAAVTVTGKNSLQHLALLLLVMAATTAAQGALWTRSVSYARTGSKYIVDGHQQVVLKLLLFIHLQPDEALYT